MGRFYFPLSATPHGSVPEDDTFMTHMIDNLRSGPLRVVYRNSIPIDLNAPGSQQTMMNYCLLSLAKIVFGSKSVQPRLLHSGLQTYGRALQILNAALREANNRITYEVLVSVFVLGLCEVCTTPQHLLDLLAKQAISRRPFQWVKIRGRPIWRAWNVSLRHAGR